MDNIEREEIDAIRLLFLKDIRFANVSAVAANWYGFDVLYANEVFSTNHQNVEIHGSP
jgi:hypothetical protein